MSEKSLFINFVGDSPIARVLDYLLTERDLDFSISDLARNARIGRATLCLTRNDLVKNQVVKFTRKIGKAKLYKLNTENPKVKKLMEIDDMLILEELKSRSKSSKLTIKA